MSPVENFPTFIMVGIVLVVGASQLNRKWGAVIGMLFWVGVAIVGHFFYATGDAIGFPGFPLSEPLFIGLCALFFGAQYLAFRSGLVRERREAAYREGLSGDSDQDPLQGS